MLQRACPPGPWVAVYPVGAGESVTGAALFDRLAAQDDGGCPDLLLLDVTFPGLNRRELLQWLKALPGCWRLRVIVMSASDDPAVEQEALAFGADAFFQKSVSFQQCLALGDRIKVLVFGHTQT